MAAGDTPDNASASSRPGTSGTQTSEAGRRTETPADANIVMRCAMKGNTQRFIKCFEDEEDPFKDTVLELVNERAPDGKSPLDMASLLGRVEMVKELINRGAEVNNATAKGYMPIHHASAWGKIQCLKALVENSADIQAKTANGERPREIAMRYNQEECVDFLDWAEAKQTFRLAIQVMRETVTDPEKVQGRITRDEKNTTVSLCNDKDAWIDNTADATTQDYLSAKQEFDETVAPVLQKISEPPSD